MAAGYLRNLYRKNEVSFYYSHLGKVWTPVEQTIYVSAINHNIFGRLQGLRVAMFISARE